MNRKLACVRPDTIEMKQRWLSFPQRGKKSAARAQRNRSVGGNVCHFKTDFILMRDEHYRIAIWSNFEDEVSFVVGSGQRARPRRQRSNDRFANLSLMS